MLKAEKPYLSDFANNYFEQSIRRTRNGPARGQAPCLERDARPQVRDAVTRGPGASGCRRHRRHRPVDRTHPRRQFDRRGVPVATFGRREDRPAAGVSAPQAGSAFGSRASCPWPLSLRHHRTTRHQRQDSLLLPKAFRGPGRHVWGDDEPLRSVEGSFLFPVLMSSGPESATAIARRAFIRFGFHLGSEPNTHHQGALVPPIDDHFGETEISAFRAS